MSELDLGTILQNAMASHRAEQMKTSPQLTIGELILMLESQDKKMKIVFDFEINGRVQVPCDLMSWRGSYCELGMDYGDRGYKNVGVFRKSLKDAIGKSYEGYKGGLFMMGKTTPIWVAHHSDCGINDYKGTHGEVIITGIKVKGKKVVLITEQRDY